MAYQAKLESYTTKKGDTGVLLTVADGNADPFAPRMRPKTLYAKTHSELVALVNVMVACLNSTPPAKAKSGAAAGGVTVRPGSNGPGTPAPVAALPDF